MEFLIIIPKSNSKTIINRFFEKYSRTGVLVLFVDTGALRNNGPEV